jgi:uncharacterized protein YcfJ
MGLNDRASSVRIVTYNTRVEDNRYAPEPIPVYDNRRYKGERLFQADVTSVHAVMGPPEQHCWVERDQVSHGGNANVPGAIIGGIIGGVLGHQVGSGRGNDVATVGGAVVGAAVGSNTGRHGGYGQDVQRCETTASQGPPAYWDVTYEFHGLQHRIQTASAPGRSVTVNGRGEPRA